MSLNIGLAVVMALVHAACVIAEPRDITVHVTVATEDEEPIADAGVEGGSAHDVGFALTDADGRVTLVFAIHEGDPEIILRLWDGEHHDLDPATRATAIERYRELRRTYSFPPYYIITPQEEVDQYDYTITAWTAVTVSLLPVNAQGEPVDAAGAVRDSIVFVGVFPVGDPLRLRGVRQGAPADLLILLSDDQMHAIHLTAEQTLANLDLGPVQIVDLPRNASIDFTMTEAFELYAAGEIDLWQWATLVPVGAGPIVTLHLNADGKAVDVTWEGDGNPPAPLPAGTYYIAPGGITPDVSMPLFDMVRTGQFAALDAAGVPKVTCVPGETATITINARDAIYAATGGP